MPHTTVKNTYKKDPDLEMRFEYCGETYSLEIKPFTLNILDSANNVRHTVSLNSYCDCFAFLDGNLYISTRHGELLGWNMKHGGLCFKMFVCDESEQTFN